MSRGLRLALVLALATALIGLTSNAAWAALKADYQFKNTRAACAGSSAPALTDIGGTNTFTTQTVAGRSWRVLRFPLGHGVRVQPTTGVVSNNVYSIAVLFRLADVSFYRRVIDFKNGTAEPGLYVHYGSLYFWPRAEGATAPIANNAYVQVVLTRNAGKTIAGYVNGVKQFSFVDSANEGVIAANTLRFFRDEAGGTEHSAGAVARLRLYNTALTGQRVSALRKLPATPCTT
jgi:hypothetical protein